MPKSDMISVEGVVVQKLPSAEFKIELPTGHQITGYLSGKTRRNYIRILAGDRVRFRAIDAQEFARLARI